MRILSYSIFNILLTNCIIDEKIRIGIWGDKIIGDFQFIMVYTESLIFIFNRNWGSENSKFSVSKSHLH